MTEKIKIVVYVANDGTEFNTKEECYKYEAEAKKISSFIRTLNAIKEFCYQKKKCSDCPFFDGYTCEITFANPSRAEGDRMPCRWEF